jgi:SAM-dependent methyltransferase
MTRAEVDGHPTPSAEADAWPGHPGVRLAWEENHEARLAELGCRKASGSYYTPPDVVDGLLRVCLDPLLTELEDRGAEAVAGVRILDPTCGTGNFLYAAFERVLAALVRCGISYDAAAAKAVLCVVGVDLDSAAVDICRAILRRAGGNGVDAPALERQIICADSLVMPRQAPLTLFASDDQPATDWETLMSEVGAHAGFDVVIGNPPYLSQLQTETMFSAPYIDKVKARFADAARGYVDPAALFLLVGLDALKERGCLCLVEPLAVLSTRGAINVRQSLLARATLTDVWFAEERVFDDADVEVWAPVLRTGVLRMPVALSRGRGFTNVGTADPPNLEAESWGSLLAVRRGVPTRNWSTAGTLADIASATADFRDQYYGLAGHIVDSAEGGVDLPRLVTSGLIDPARLMWGQRSTTFNRVRFVAPRVNVAELSEDLQAWARKRLVPKVLVATQTRVLEPIVDFDGSLLPSVPVVTVETSGDSLWRVAAVLGSPPIAAIAASRHFGAALSADALKLSARDILALPLPSGTEDWDASAKAFELASQASCDSERYERLMESGEAMCSAYGLGPDDELLKWWADRWPKSTSVDEGFEDELRATLP